MKTFLFLAAILGASCLHAASIDAVYFAQTHVQKADAAYPTLVGNRDALIKVHVTDPGESSSPPVTAILNLNGGSTTITLSGPATLPASIADGPGVVQHSFADSFTGTIPATWLQPGLTVDVSAGAASTSVTTLDIGAPTELVMTSANVHFFELNKKDYPSGWDTEIEAKLPVSKLIRRETPDVVFHELAVPPSSSDPAVRVVSKADYEAQLGIGFNRGNDVSTAWNVALRRAAGLGDGGYANGMSLYMLFKYNVPAKDVAGGFSGVATRGPFAHGVFWHAVGHSLSLPHWGDNGGYPYKGPMFGINPPAIYKETHAGPTWAFDPPSQTFIPCTVQPDNEGGNPAGTYKGEPMQGGGKGFQEPPFLFNHFSDYSANRMREYLESKVVVWNSNLGSYAKWNDIDKDYTTTVANDGVKYPLQRDQSVISVMAAVTGASPDVCMVYPPVGPYTAGLIRLFDPSNATDRSDAQSIFAPPGGCDATLRVTQGGVVSDYMLRASYDTAADPTDASKFFTAAVNLPAADGDVTKVELLLTPDAEVNGLPTNPEVLYTWSTANPPSPNPATFAANPSAVDDTSITMTATVATGDSDFNGQVEYLFTETSGNLGGSSSGWQSSTTYTDTGLQPETEYRYTVTARSGVSKAAGTPSAEAAAITDPTPATETVLTVSGTVSWHDGTAWTAGIPQGTIDARIQNGVSTGVNSATPQWTGRLFIDANASLAFYENTADLLAGITEMHMADNATFKDRFPYTGSLPPIILNGNAAMTTDGHIAAKYHNRNMDGVISGSGSLSTNGRFRMIYRFNASNTFTGGLTINNFERHLVEFNAPQAAGAGDVTVNRRNSTDPQSAVLIVNANDVFSPNATLSLNGTGLNGGTHYVSDYNNTNTRLDMNTYSASVARLFIDGVEQLTGTYTGTDGEWIKGSGVLTVTGPLTYTTYSNDYPNFTSNTGFTEDADGDGLENGLEYYFGSDPTASSPSMQVTARTSNSVSLSHPLNTSFGSDATADYLWSEDLITFHSDGAGNANGTTVNFVQGALNNGVVGVTATVGGPVPDQLFFRIRVTQVP